MSTITPTSDSEYEYYQQRIKDMQKELEANQRRKDDRLEDARDSSDKRLNEALRHKDKELEETVKDQRQSWGESLSRERQNEKYELGRMKAEQYDRFGRMGAYTQEMENLKAQLKEQVNQTEMQHQKDKAHAADLEDDYQNRM